MDRNAVSLVVSELRGLEWCLYAGAAVAAYSRDRRPLEDLDIAIAGEGIYTFADRIGTTVEHRSFGPAATYQEDHGFTTVTQGIAVEATRGFPRCRVVDGTFHKVITNSREKRLYGERVRVCPIEDLFIFKADLFREKDRRDLKRLNNEPFDREFLHELLYDWQADGERITSNLSRCGIDI